MENKWKEKLGIFRKQGDLRMENSLNVMMKKTQNCSSQETNAPIVTK